MLRVEIISSSLPTLRLEALTDHVDERCHEPKAEQDPEVNHDLVHEEVLHCWVAA